MKKSLMLAVLVVAMLAIGVSSAFADTSAVTVSAQVNAKLTLTLDKSAVDFGAVTPGTAVAPQTVNVNVKSNKDYTLGSATTGQNVLMGLGTATPPAGTISKATGPGASAGNNWLDTYSLAVPWDTAPSATALAATVTYTVVQQ